MKKYLLNYADKMYYNSQKICTEKAYESKFEKVFECNLSNLDTDFIQKNKSILSEARGAGYWLWKPYLINKVLEYLPKESYLFYLDSGAFFIKPVDSLINLMADQLEEHGVVLFETSKWCPNGPPWEKCIEKNWTKGDVFHLLDVRDEISVTHTPQVNGATILLKTNDKSKNFVSEWLEISKRREALTDDPNIYLDNFEGFEEHRHDQSILSCLAKKYKKPIFEDITQWGEPRSNSLLDTYIYHHRDKR